MHLRDLPQRLDEPGEHGATTPSGARRRGRPPRPSRSRASARARASEICSTPSPSSGSRAVRPPSSSGARKRRTSSISPASRNAPARCGPPSSRIEVMPVGAELGERAAHARLLVLAGGDDDLGAGHLEPVRRARAARRARRRRSAADLAGRLHELRVEREPALGVEDDAARLAHDAVDARGELRVVGQRGADPDATASTAARQWCASPRLSSLEIHFESPVRVATLPSSVIADLKRTHGRPVRACLRKAWLSSRARAASSPSATSTSMPSSRRIPRPRPEAFSVGSSEATTTRAMPRGEDRVGARRRAALVAARLERDVERRARRCPSPAAAIALTSACGPPSSSCQPSPSTTPSRTTTAPTTGFGETRPTPRRASSTARARWRRSVSVRSAIPLEDTARSYCSPRCQRPCRPGFGPTLPALLRERFGIAPRTLAVVAARRRGGRGAGVAVARVLAEPEKQLVHEGEPVFNLLYDGDVLHEVEPEGGRARAAGGQAQARVGRRVRPAAAPAAVPRRRREGPAARAGRALHGRTCAGSDPTLHHPRRGAVDGQRRRPATRSPTRRAPARDETYWREIFVVPDEEAPRRRRRPHLREPPAAADRAQGARTFVNTAKSAFRSFRFGTERG